MASISRHSPRLETQGLAYKDRSGCEKSENCILQVQKRAIEYVPTTILPMRGAECQIRNTNRLGAQPGLSDMRLQPPFDAGQQFSMLVSRDSHAMVATGASCGTGLSTVALRKDHCHPLREDFQEKRIIPWENRSIEMSYVSKNEACRWDNILCPLSTNVITIGDVEIAQNAVSGPRRQNEGIDDVIQGLTGIKSLADGALQLDMTLLVAGFIIGPGGVSIRDIIYKTGARISSWTQCTREFERHNMRKIRVFLIKGGSTEIYQALETILKAVWRYKELAEGSCKGKRVPSPQMIGGVEFLYRPPPKIKIPYAASIECVVKK